MRYRVRSRSLSLALGLVFLFSIMLGALPLQPAYAQFSDIKGNWAEKQISDWANRGLAGGYPDGTFKPNNLVTRAEFVALTNRAFGKQNPAAQADFKDVKASDWFYAEVAAARTSGYITGYTDGTFRPLDPITRQEVASIVSRLLELDPGAAGKTFADAGSIAAWAINSVNAVTAAGIMSGYPNGAFKGANPITRAEALVTLDRAVSLTAKPVTIPEGITGFVKLDGKAIEGAVVLLFSENGTEPVKETTSGKDGKFAFQVGAGTYDITAVKDKYLAFVAGLTFAKNGVAQDLDLAEGVLISGRLVDKNGNAVKNSKLFFTTNPTFLTTTDGYGEFSLYVPGGRKYTVRGYKNNQKASGLEVLADNIEVAASGNKSAGTITATYSLGSTGGGGGGGGGGTPGGPTTYTLTLSANPSEGGTITDNTAAGPYAAGTAVSVTATANNGYQFVNWTVGGNEVSTDATFNFTMPSANTTLVANFDDDTLDDETPSDFAGGSGTEADPYQVATAEQLDNVRNYLYSHFIQTADIDLGVSPWIDGTGWVPIGNNLEKFTGSYDGNEFKITGLTISISDPENGWNTGLFGFTTKDASLDNITLEDATLNGKNEIGSLVGKNYGTVSNCSSINVNLTGYSNVGGLIGVNYGLVQNSYTSGEVLSTYSYAGGLIGENASYSDAQYLAEAGNVLYCHSSAIVTGFDGSGSNYVSLIGGLIGNDSRGNIEHSYATGTVTGYERVGGLIGNAYDTQISNCYATGNVTGSYYDVGGLVGETTNTIIENCHASGNVVGPYYVGGLVGDHDGSMTDCYSEGTVTGTNRVGGLVGYNNNSSTISKSYSTGIVSGNEFLGGLVGYNNGEVIESFASGSVTGTYLITGGLVGYNFAGTIEDCYATGNVTGNGRVGGLVGDNRSSISNSYSSGAVSGSSDVGGLIGYDNAGVYNSCYYNTDTTGQTDVGKGTPKTTAEMKKQSTYVGWDFNAVWGINPGENSGYPFLRWQGYEHEAATATLLGHWTFNEGSGTVVYDSSGNEYDGTVEGALWTNDRHGNPNKALGFGVDKWVNIPDALKAEEITLCAWIYITGTDSSAAPVFSAEKGWGGTGFAYRLQVTPDTKLRMEAIAPYSATGQRVATSENSLDLNRWYHVAGTYDGYDTKVYIDGVLAGSSSFANYEALNTDQSIPVAIGHLEGWSVQWFRGVIDDARIYDAALSNEEIAELHGI